jgi:lipid A 3-O-deacylase
MMKCYYALCLLALSGASARAETLEEAFTKKVEAKPNEQFLTLTLENDLFGGGGDRNYTSGVRLTWFDTGTESPYAMRMVDRLVPMFSINETTSVYYSIGHNLYTPRNILTSVPDPRDRPYAAFLYGAAGLTSITKNRMDNLEATLGVIGPAALGRPIQKFVHRFSDSDDPQGWGSQLDNEPGVMLSWQRLWPETYTAEVQDMHFRVSPYIGTTLGNIYTYANTGLLFQFMPQAYKWQSAPLRVRPSMPGSGYFSVPEHTFSWSIFAGLDVRAVGRNIFLDGNTFHDGPSVDKKPLVGDANMGVAFTYGHTQLSYTLNVRSEEFHGQPRPDLFGAVGLGYRF